MPVGLAKGITNVFAVISEIRISQPFQKTPRLFIYSLICSPQSNDLAGLFGACNLATYLVRNSDGFLHQKDI